MKWTLKVAMTKSKALLWHLSGGTEESHEPHPPTRTANLKVRTHKLHNTKHLLQCSMYTYKLCNVYPLIQKNN